jgi:hypothetical protein
MTISAKETVSRAANAVYRMVDGEAVIVEPQNGLVNVINEAGSRIWELIDNKRSASQIADIISSEYEISAKIALEDTIAFLDEMAEKGLVKLTR